MQRKRKALWMAAVIVGLLDLMVPTSQGQAPNQPPSAMQPAHSLKPPASGKINVAFVISEGADSHGHRRPLGDSPRRDAYNQRQAME